jgi:hypothetical protein
MYVLNLRCDTHVDILPNILVLIYLKLAGFLREFKFFPSPDNAYISIMRD